RYPETDLLQDSGEQRILLKAVTAAPIANQLRLQAIQTQANGPAQQDVEVLEWNVGGVSQVQPFQYLLGWGERSHLVNAGQIGVEVQGRGNVGLHSFASLVQRILGNILSLGEGGKRSLDGGHPCQASLPFSIGELFPWLSGTFQGR